MIKAKYTKTPFREGVTVDIKGDNETISQEFRALCLSFLREGFTESDLTDEIKLAEEIKKMCEGE